jgi:AraC family transcriptional activator of mtrCDE
MTDYITDILAHLSVTGTLYFRTSLTPPFGVQVPEFENVARFHYAHKGKVTVVVRDLDSHTTLEQGDLIIVPHGASHTLLSDVSAASHTCALDTFLQDAGYDGTGVLVYGGDASSEEIELICGHFSFGRGARHPLLARLPSAIVVRGYGAMAGPWLAETLAMLGRDRDASQKEPDLLALRLSETILAQALRKYFLDTGPNASALSGFGHPQLTNALAAIHAEPGREWTVDELARQAGLSRSGFASLFREKTGMPPMGYLRQWRLQLARHALTTGKIPISRAADIAGYKSEAAFSRAFKKETGYSPSALRNRGQAEQ